MDAAKSLSLSIKHVQRTADCSHLQGRCCDEEVRLQAARLFGLLDQRWRDRAMQLNKLTGATSLPPTWFTLRKPDGLEGPRSEESRYRYCMRPACAAPEGVLMQWLYLSIICAVSYSS